MGKPSPPKPADPKVTAGATTATNIGTAIAQQELNNIKQITPDGTREFSRTGEYQYEDPNSGQTHTIPNYTETVTLSAPQQAIKDQHDQTQLNLAQLGNSQSQSISQMLGTPLDHAGLPERGDMSAVQAPEFQNIGDVGDIARTYGQDDFSSDRQRVEDALLARMQPSLDRDREQLETRLASQGIRAGSQAFNDAFQTHAQQVNDARFGAILNAGQEQSRLTGLEAQRAAFENSAQAQAFGQESARVQQNNNNAQNLFNAGITRVNAANNDRNQALDEQSALRDRRINEITALMSGSQVKSPQFNNINTAQIANTDFASIQNNYDQLKNDQYKTQSESWGQMVGGLMGGASSMMMMSDRRAKENIRKVGETDDGQNIYSYRYKAGGPTQLGLMAQEVEKKKPGAVVECRGLKMVNYDKALA